MYVRIRIYIYTYHKCGFKDTSYPWRHKNWKRSLHNKYIASWGGTCYPKPVKVTSAAWSSKNPFYEYHESPMKIDGHRSLAISTSGTDVCDQTCCHSVRPANHCQAAIFLDIQIPVLYKSGPKSVLSKLGSAWAKRSFGWSQLTEKHHHADIFDMLHTL